MTEKKSDVLQGTLELMVLKSLHAMGPMHRFVAGVIERVLRLERQG